MTMRMVLVGAAVTTVVLILVLLLDGDTTTIRTSASSSSSSSPSASSWSSSISQYPTSSQQAAQREQQDSYQSSTVTMTSHQPSTHETKRLTLPPLPYPLDALEPHISKKQLTLHYEKHHQGYFDELNDLARADPSLGIQNQTLDHLLKNMKTPGLPLHVVGQAWNHIFYWNSMAPAKHGGGGAPSHKLAEALSRSFGSVDKFKEEFSLAAFGHFGSGWAWLVQGSDGKLKVVQTHDGGNPLRESAGGKPLLCCDVWEHAYYLDRPAARKEYIQHWWEIVNWNFVEKCLEAEHVGPDGPLSSSSSSSAPLSTTSSR